MSAPITERGKRAARKFALLRHVCVLCKKRGGPLAEYTGLGAAHPLCVLRAAYGKKEKK